MMRLRRASGIATLVVLAWAATASGVMPSCLTGQLGRGERVTA